MLLLLLILVHRIRPIKDGKPLKRTHTYLRWLYSAPTPESGKRVEHTERLAYPHRRRQRERKKNFSLDNVLFFVTAADAV